jgi:hypothetical protein
MASVHRSWLQHGFHHLILGDQFVLIDGVRVSVQSGTNVGVSHHGLDRLHIRFGLRHEEARE